MTSCAPVMLRCRAKGNELGAFRTTIGFAATLTARPREAVSDAVGNMVRIETRERK